MCQECNKYIIEALELSRRLIDLADKGDSEREDVGCGILFGTMRDYGYKLMALSNAEIANHKKAGIWDLDRVPVVPSGSVSYLSEID